ncbi:MAG: hypothetical protein M5R41_10870 [Bacteroidia bacterium]|nr:hypothetical protein [Bacteroidia bacterium]
MARRRRVDIFLILYLTAIVGFAVISRERDHATSTHAQRHEHLVAQFIPPLPLVPENDTVRYYVSADDRSGIVSTAVPPFSTKIFVHDIDPDDQVTMTLHSIVRDSLLTSPDLLQIGERTGYGNVYDRVVYFPLTGRFPRTGTYTVNLKAGARRIQRAEGGSIEYRGLKFDTSDISHVQVKALEHATGTVVIQVIDTSLARPKTLEALRIQSSQTSISSAIGFEEQNTITANLGWSAPHVSIVSGSGTLTKVTRTDRQVEYRWSGVVRSLPDTVVIEARLDRGAGGKDIARTQFTLNGTQPFLFEQPPLHLYAGEEMSVNLQVRGLEQEALYTWSLYEIAGVNETVIKASGTGPVGRWRIPTSYVGKRLVLEVRYMGRLYRYLSTQTHRSGISRISLPVEVPPTRIAASLPERAPSNAAFRFTASRYSHPRFMGEQPIDKISDVAVEITASGNRRFEASVSMIRKGEFEFELENSAAVAAGGEQVLVTIRAAGAIFQHAIRLTR